MDKLKEIVQLQNNIKVGRLEHTKKRGERYNFSRYSLPFALFTYCKRNYYKMSSNVERKV